MGGWKGKGAGHKVRDLLVKANMKAEADAEPAPQLVMG